MSEQKTHYAPTHEPATSVAIGRVQVSDELCALLEDDDE